MVNSRFIILANHDVQESPLARSIMQSKLYRVYINADLSMFAMYTSYTYIYSPFQHKQEGRKKNFNLSGILSACLWAKSVSHAAAQFPLIPNLRPHESLPLGMIDLSFPE